MNCNEWRSAIAAITAGATTDVGADEIRAHLERCPDCRRHRDAIFRSPASGTDLPATIVREARRRDRAAIPPLLHTGLLVTAVSMLVLHVPELVVGSGNAIADHPTRHAAACPVAFAVALFVVALRPSRARGLLPVTAALAATLLVTAAIDVAMDVTPALAETDHLVEVLGAVLVWLTSHYISHPPARTADARHLHVAGG